MRRDITLPTAGSILGVGAVSKLQVKNPLGWKGWTWPLALATTIWIASGRGDVVTPDIVGIDKVTHFFLFGLLASLVARNGFLPGRGWVAVMLVAVFGFTDEWHQSFTPGRSVEFADWVADTLGAMVAVFVYARWGAYRRLMESRIGFRHTQVEKSGAILPNADVHDSRASDQTHR